MLPRAMPRANHHPRRNHRNNRNRLWYNRLLPWIMPIPEGSGLDQGDCETEPVPDGCPTVEPSEPEPTEPFPTEPGIAEPEPPETDEPGEPAVMVPEPGEPASQLPTTDGADILLVGTLALCAVLIVISGIGAWLMTHKGHSSTW